jgi:hypothetical protein
MKREDITSGLDLLGDWLDAKGYTEEAGLCTKAMDEINALREALNPFAVVAELTIGESEHDMDLFRPARSHPRLIIADFRKALKAMGWSDA